MKTNFFHLHIIEFLYLIENFIDFKIILVGSTIQLILSFLNSKDSVRSNITGNYYSFCQYYKT